MDTVESANLYVDTALAGWAAALHESDEAMTETLAAAAELEN